MTRRSGVIARPARPAVAFPAAAAACCAGAHTASVADIRARGARVCRLPRDGHSLPRERNDLRCACCARDASGGRVREPSGRSPPAVDAGRAEPTAPEEFAAAVCALLPVMGCVAETLSMMLLMLPVIDPSHDALGIDPIRFGVILTPMIECAPIAPPVDPNLFVIRAVPAGGRREGDSRRDGARRRSSP